MLSPERWLTKATTSTNGLAAKWYLSSPKILCASVLGVTDLLSLLNVGIALGSGLLLALSLLQQGLRNENLVLCWHRSIGGSDQYGPEGW